MTVLNVLVANKIATYQNRDGDLVCGNRGYQVKFTFDEEWDAYETKTARFIWSNQYFDVEFTGDTCEAPVITGVNLCYVGVYAGDLCTTTAAEIPCKRSILCGGELPNAGTGQHYTAEAKQYMTTAKAAAELAEASATEAAASAEEAKEAAENAGGGGGMTEIGSVTITLTSEGTGGANYISADGNAELWALAYTKEPKFVKITNNYWANPSSAWFGCAKCYSEYGSLEAQRALDFAAIEAVSEETLPWQCIHFSDVVKGIINAGAGHGEASTVTFTFYA